MNVLFFLPILVTVVGVYMLFRLRFFFFRPVSFSRDIRSLIKKRGALKNLCLALSGTLGVGNIVGVAVGLKIGGAGSVFWLVLSAIPAAAIKYSESSVAVSLGKRTGMMGVIESSFSRGGAKMAKLYAFFAVLLAFVLGAGLQCASFTETLSSLFGAIPVVFVILLLIPAAYVVLAGADKIKSITAIFVSVASIVYVFTCIYLIFLGRDALPSALAAIFKGAFTPSGMLGGVGASFTAYAVKEGFCRGILSNEAGLGTSAMAHSSDVGYTPHEAGMVGVLEVVFDTAVLCPLSALMLLVSGDSTKLFPMDYVVSAVEKGGDALVFLFAVSVFSFAFSTVVCWISYGSLAFSYAFGERRKLFSFLFLISLPIGSLLGSALLVSATDYVMLPLAVLSMLAVIKNSETAEMLFRSRDKLHDFNF